MSHGIIIKGAVKRYSNFTALRGVNLEVKQGRFFTLLGPPGCGKTTLLKMVMGSNNMDDGEICFDGKVINSLEAHKRDIGMVFQNYAIFPHLTVVENVAYGLKTEKYSKDQALGKVEEAFNLVQIKSLKDRKPSEPSGGQQQRVVLARVSVIRPGMLLTDEPLPDLNTRLKARMRTVIKKLQRRLGITTTHMTYDQEEALVTSDRIAVIKEDEVMRVGPSENIYKRPQNIFVVGFIGVPNFVECDINGENPEAVVLDIKSEYMITCSLKVPFKREGITSARPERLFFNEEEGLPREVMISTFLGDFAEHRIEPNSG